MKSAEANWMYEPTTTRTRIETGEIYYGKDAMGYWERPEYATPKSYTFRCSVCGQTCHYVTKNEGCGYRYCPWCGIRMASRRLSHGELVQMERGKQNEKQTDD